MEENEVKNLKKKLIEKAESLEWSVNIYDKKDWEFEKYSPAGEDFIFSVTAEKPEELWREVRIYANEFDTEEHIEMWVMAKADGRGGIPSIRRLVEDADAIDEMLDELADALREVTEDIPPKKNKKSVDAKWITFSLRGEEIAAFTIKGYCSGEIQVTKELLAYEKGVDPSDIVVGAR